VVAYIKDLEQFLDYVELEFGAIQLSEINHKTIRGWLVDLLDVKGVSTNSVNRKLSSLKTYYRYLLLSDKYDVDPTLKVVSPKISKKLPEFVDQVSMNKLLSPNLFEDDFMGLRDQLVMELLYQTGIRLSELTGIKIGDVDRGVQSIKVTGKRNKQRIVPVGVELQRLISDYLVVRNSHGVEVDELIITQKGKAAYPKLIYNVVNKYLGMVSTINKKSPHVLRHTFATHMLNNGADLNTIKELLGHASLSATQVYTHNSFEKLKTIYNQAHPRA
jgi:integrase/recombinase XerC